MLLLPILNPQTWLDGLGFESVKIVILEDKVDLC